MSRPGNTEKISISVRPDDLRFLKKRASGNVSAAIAELIEMARRDQARRELIEWLGSPPLTDQERREIRHEQIGSSSRKPKKGRAA
jgi:hypothetical protein